MQRLFLIVFAGLYLVSACTTTSQEIPGEQPITLPFKLMESEISKGNFPKTTGILINQHGKLLYESYFGEGDREMLNDTRSVSKSLTALVTGQVITSGALGSVNDFVSPWFEAELQAPNKGALRSDIRVKDLLTMSSALAADDQDDKSPGNEDRMHEQKNWTSWAVNLPVNKSFKRDDEGLGPFHYSSAQAFLMGQVLQKSLKQPIDGYMKKSLLQPLGIEKYEFQYSPSGETMTAGGLKLRGLDLLNLGQMVLSGGVHEGQQIISRDWIQQCLTVMRRDPDSGAGYGYFFWNMSFPASDGDIDGWFMAGNGGNIVLMLPTLDAVVVITRTNYNAPKMAIQTIRLISQFIIPELKRARTAPAA